MPDQTWEEFKAGVAPQAAHEMQAGPQRPTYPFARAAATTLGGVAGGLAGGLAGGIGAVPGAMGGAGLARYLFGRLGEQETPGEAIGPAAGQAALEGLLPGAGKLLKFGGRRLVQSALPRAQDLAEQVGRGNPFAGQQELARRITNLPGLTPRRSFEAAQRGIEGAEQAIGREVRQATTAGVTIPTRRIEQLGRGQMSRIGRNLGEPGGQRMAGRVLRKFEQATTTERPMTDTEAVAAVRRGDLTGAPVQVKQPLTPLAVRRFQQATEFVPGGRSPSADLMTGTLRTGLSRELKKAVPGVRAPLAQQAELIPARDLLGRMAGSGGTPVRGEMILGPGGMRPIGVLGGLARATKFGGGKILERTGRGVGSVVTPGFLRALAALAAQQEQP